MLNEKEEELNDLKSKSEGIERKKSESDLTPEEVKELKDMFVQLQDEYEEYKKSAEEKIKNYINDCDKFFNEAKELKEKNIKLESEISLKNDKIENLENEKRLNEKRLEEKKENEESKMKDIYA